MPTLSAGQPAVVRRGITRMVSVIRRALAVAAPSTRPVNGRASTVRVIRAAVSTMMRPALTLLSAYVADQGIFP